MTHLMHATDHWSVRLSHTPAREIVTPTGSIIRGRFPSVKAKRMVRFEQLLERDALYLFEFTRQVADIREQPFKLRYSMNTRTRLYTPDYALYLTDGSFLIVEVKPARSLAKPEVHEKLICIRDAMQRQGHQFIVLSSETIRAPHRLDNLKQLHRYLRLPLSIELLRMPRQLKDRFGRRRSIPLPWLKAALGSIEPILHLLALGQVSCDLDQPITDDTLITLEKQEADYVFVDSL